VDELHMYDIYANMLKDYERSVTYEEAKEMLLEGLAPLGEHYLELLREAFEASRQYYPAVTEKRRAVRRKGGSK